MRNVYGPPVSFWNARASAHDTHTAYVLCIVWCMHEPSVRVAYKSHSARYNMYDFSPKCRDAFTSRGFDMSL